MGNSFGTSLELVGKSDVFVLIVWGMHRGCWGRSGEFMRGFYELFRKQLIFVGPAGECIGNSSGILTNYLGNRWYSSGPLENLWGLLVKNSFVGRGPNTNRAHPHACNIPYKTALPVPCTHRFGGPADLFRVFFRSFFCVFFERVRGFILGGFWKRFAAIL